MRWAMALLVAVVGLSGCTTYNASTGEMSRSGFGELVSYLKATAQPAGDDEDE